MGAGHGEAKKEKRKRFPSLLRRLSLVKECIDKSKSAKQVKGGSQNFYLESRVQVFLSEHLDLLDSSLLFKYRAELRPNLALPC